MDLALNDLQRLICHKTQTGSQNYILDQGVGKLFGGRDTSLGYELSSGGIF